MTDEPGIPLGLVETGASADACEAHKQHDPRPLYCEHHHVIPRAWQAFFHPSAAQPYAGGGVWDNRTVALCRTGHGNVHWWIVAYMKTLEADPALVNPADIVDATHDRYAQHYGRNFSDRRIAAQALNRFDDVGGDLHALVAARLYGGI